MASTYENDLRLEEMATGENSGSWGTKTNTNLEIRLLPLLMVRLTLLVLSLLK
jgi:hypothetical protein